MATKSSRDVFLNNREAVLEMLPKLPPPETL